MTAAFATPIRTPPTSANGALFDVPRRSYPEKSYVVSLDPPHCTCKGFHHRGNCSYIRELRAGPAEDVI